MLNVCQVLISGFTDMVSTAQTLDAHLAGTPETSNAAEVKTVTSAFRRVCILPRRPICASESADRFPSLFACTKSCSTS